jgi:hypothetical protein
MPNLKREFQMEDRIVELFGKFAVMVDDKIKYFDSRAEAELAAAACEHSDEFKARALAYTEAMSLTGKNAVGKHNVIESFLLWESLGNEPTEESVEDLLENV